MKKRAEKRNKIKREYFQIIFLMLFLAVGIIVGAVFFIAKGNDLGFISLLKFKMYGNDPIWYFTATLLTFSCYLLSGLFLSLSSMGYIIIPIESFLLGLSLSVSVYEAYLLIGYKALLIYLPFWALYTAFLQLYLAEGFGSSLEMYKRFCFEKKEEDAVKNIFKKGIKDFYASAVVTAIYTLIVSFIEYSLGPINQ